MPSSNNFINNIRNKPESTKNILAATFALIPAILVGYAQFYMNAKASDDKIAEQKQMIEPSSKEAISAFASIGKIFSEGKATVGDALGDLKKIDNELLKDKNINDNKSVNVLDDKLNTATGTIDVSDSLVNVKDTE